MLYQLWHAKLLADKKLDRLHAFVKKCALEMVLEESDRIISEPSLKVKTPKLTVAEIREVLKPEVLESKTQELAPFTWELLYVFSASDNRYRKRKAAQKSGSNDVEMEDEKDNPEWMDDPLFDDTDRPAHPADSIDAPRKPKNVCQHLNHFHAN
jgi:hypothetical protein